MAYLYDAWDFPYLIADEGITSDGLFSSNCTINSYDALSKWGVLLEKESIALLMTPPPLKEVLENDEPTDDGVILYDNAKVDKRKLSVTFILVAKTPAEALTKFNLFQAELFAGRFTLKVPSINMKFRLLYQSCATYRPWYEGISKLVLNVVEPDPTNRG